MAIIGFVGIVQVREWKGHTIEKELERSGKLQANGNFGSLCNHNNVRHLDGMDDRQNRRHTQAINNRGGNGRGINDTFLGRVKDV